MDDDLAVDERAAHLVGGRVERLRSGPSLARACDLVISALTA